MLVGEHQAAAGEGQEAGQARRLSAGGQDRPRTVSQVNNNSLLLLFIILIVTIL